jgi:mono/diheme cytochrome c family protein
MAVKKVIPAIGLLILALVACGGGEPGTSGPPGTSQAASGERIFRTHCTLCHGNDGALGLNQAKDLTVSELSRDEMIAMVTHGKGTMMSYKNVLTKAEIEAVVEHVRSLQATE